MDPVWASASEIAQAVSDRIDRPPRRVVEETLADISARDPILNAFTTVTDARARARAQALDSRRAQGQALGPLAGVPFAVKNLFDVAGLPTLAGSKINRENKPASRDAPLIERLEAAGAILVGALNMGEYAYDFTGENVALRPVAQSARPHPHDRRLIRRLRRRSRRRPRSARARLRHQWFDPGAVVAVRIVWIEADLWPAAAQPHVPVRDEPRSSWPAGAQRARSRAWPTTRCRALIPTIRSAPTARPSRPSNLLDAGTDGLRIAVAGSYFQKGAFPEARIALDRVAAALHAKAEIEIPQAALARSAAYLITTIEGASLHLERVRKRAQRFRPGGARPLHRRRHGAGNPRASRRRNSAAGIATKCSSCSTRVDAILAPATPCTAPEIGQQTFNLDGVEMPVRANLGIYTQPISFIGLPGRRACRCRSRRCPSGCRSLRRPGAKTSRCGSRTRWKKWVSSAAPRPEF